MSFLLFLLVIVLVVILLRRKDVKPPEGDYQQGYWDGYRALGKQVQYQLDQSEIDSTELQAAVDAGVTGVVPALAQNNMQESGVASPLQLATNLTVPVPPSANPVVVSDDNAEAKSLRSLNVILYMASFLLVSAGALFIGSAMPDESKLFGVWVIIAAFYGTGYIMHRSSIRLQPASIAFLGTGLALIPFAGVALNQYGAVDPTISWFIISIIGVAVYIFTAVRLQSQLVSYLAVAFVLSLIVSTSATLSVGLVWQFVSMIIVALIANSIALVKPQLVPKVFSEPVEQTGQLLAPLVLVASLFVGEQLGLKGHEIIFAVTTLYYIVACLQARTLLNETALRIILSVTIMLFAYDWSQANTTAVGITLLLVASLQAAYSLYRFAAPDHNVVERLWFIPIFVLQWASCSWWQSSEHTALFDVVALLVIGLTSLGAAVRFRQALFGLVGVVASYIVPFAIIRSLMDPAWPLSIVVVWFAVATAVTIAGLVYSHHRSVAVRIVLSVAYVGYVLLGVIAVFGHGSLGFATLMLFIFMALLATASFAVKQPRALVLAIILLFTALGSGWSWLELPGDWMLLSVTWIAALKLYFCSWIPHVRLPRQFLQRQILVIFVGAALAFSGMVQLWDGSMSIAVAAALTLSALAVLLAVEGYVRRLRWLIEIGIYIATFALQRLVNLFAPDVSMVVYGHWWALTVAATTLLYTKPTQTRIIVGLAIMSFTSASYALGEGGWYQLLFLVEHLGLLVFGALRAKSWALWWGLVGSALAVVYFLGGLNFLSLGFLGLLLIGIVVWRLLRQQQSN